MRRFFIRASSLTLLLSLAGCPRAPSPAPDAGPASSTGGGSAGGTTGGSVGATSGGATTGGSSGLCATNGGAPAVPWTPFVPRARSGALGVLRRESGQFLLNRQRPGWTDPSGQITWSADAGPGVPVVGDWDGDGIVTTGFWDPSTQTFTLSDTLGDNAADATFQFCSPGDAPIAGDWTGSGITTIGCFTASTASWCLRNRNAAGSCDIGPFTFGSPGDVPLVGDWDGDGTFTVGVYTPSTQRFQFINQNQAGSADITCQFGSAGDTPIVGDWNGDGVWTPGTFQSSTATWFLTDDFTGGAAEITVTWGKMGDIPLVGNWGNPVPRTGFAPFANLFPIAADFQLSTNFGDWGPRNVRSLIRYPNNCPSSTPMGCGCEDGTSWSQAAQDAGFFEIRSVLGTAASDTDPNLLAWEQADEPEGNGIAPGTLLESYQADHASNPLVPVFSNFVGFDIWTQDDGCDGPGDTGNVDCYPSFLASCDWLSEDEYISQGDVTAMGRTLDKLERWAPGTPAFTYLQASSCQELGTPSPGQMDAQIWQGLTHGVRGFWYFAAGVGTTCVNDSTDASDGQEMAIQDAVLGDLATVLQTEVNPPLAEINVGLPIVSGAPVWLSSGWRVGGDGSAYFFVSNPSDRSLTATLEIRGFQPPYYVLGENRFLTSYSESFAPEQVHIYVAGNLAISQMLSDYSSSLEDGGWSIARLVDGRKTSQSSLDSLGWSSDGQLTSPHDEFVVIDTGLVQPVNRVELYPRTDGVNLGYGFPTALTISVSSEGTNWNTVATASNIALPTQRQAFQFPAAMARYVKVQGSARPNPNDNGNYRVQLAEAEIYASPNQALGVVPTASSDLEGSGWGLASVTDGWTTSFPSAMGWSSNGNLSAAHSESLQFDLGGCGTVSMVVLYPRSDGANGGYGFPTALTISMSLDGNTWTPVVSASEIPRPTVPQYYRIAPTPARFVQLSGTARSSPNDSGNYRLQLAEVGIY